MAVTSKEIRTPRQPVRRQAEAEAWPQALMPVGYTITLVLAVMAIYFLVGALIDWGRVRYDDMRYGFPRTTHLEGMVGHEAASGMPSHFTAMNLNGQVVIMQLVGGNTAEVRSFPGPYLFGEGSDLTPVGLALHDVDKDGAPDLVVDVKREQIIYLNRDGTFRLPNAEEQQQLIAAQ
jgi:hypothetical protein